MNFFLNEWQTLSFFDLTNFVNLILGGVIGGAVSAVVSRHFFLKSKPFEDLIKEVKYQTYWLSYNLGAETITQKQPQFFGVNSTSVNVNEPTPSDTDIPHLNSVRLNSFLEPTEVLISVIDTGRNFPPAGSAARLLTIHGEYKHSEYVGFNYYKIKLSKGAMPLSTLTFELTDSLGKSNFQSINLSPSPLASMPMVASNCG